MAHVREQDERRSIDCSGAKVNGRSADVAFLNNVARSLSRSISGEIRDSVLRSRLLIAIDRQRPSVATSLTFLPYPRTALAFSSVT